MAEERKRFLKEKIFNEIKALIEDSDTSLEELEDLADEFHNMMVNMDDLMTLKEEINDK